MHVVFVYIAALSPHFGRRATNETFSYSRTTRRFLSLRVASNPRLEPRSHIVCLFLIISLSLSLSLSPSLSLSLSLSFFLSLSLFLSSSLCLSSSAAPLAALRRKQVGSGKSNNTAVCAAHNGPRPKMEHAISKTRQPLQVLNNTL